MAKTRAVRTRAREAAKAPVKRWQLKEAFDEFLRAKRLEQLKERTLQDHETHFRYLLEWLNLKYPEIHFVDQMAVKVIREYIEYMLFEKQKWGSHEFAKSNERGLSPVTVNVRLRTLKCLFGWFTQEAISEEDPTGPVHLLRTEEDTLRGFNDEEVEKLLSQPNQGTYVGYRDFALMLLLLDTGARITETLSLTLESLDIDNRTVYFVAATTKTRKGRTIPLSKRTTEVLAELIEENRENFGPGQNRLFVTVIGDPLERHVVSRRLKAYGEQAGITGCRVSPHTFRHTFARMFIQSGGDAFSLQRLLGHRSMDMVRKYIQLQQEDLQQSHERFSPVQRFQF